MRKFKEHFFLNFLAICSGRGIRTPDLKVMSLSSCLCSTPQYYYMYRRQDSNLRDINAKGYEPSPIVHSGTTVLVAEMGVEPNINRL